MRPLQEGWRGPILQQFGQANAMAGRLTVVHDPDALVTDPGVAEHLASCGFELMRYSDPVAFRYAFETRFRQQRARGEARHLVVLVQGDQSGLDSIPYDILEEAGQSGRVLAFSLSKIFPSLTPNVVAELDSEYFDAIARALKETDPGNLGANATQDFLLRHVFEIAPELIKDPADLLRVLLRRHYRARSLPETLAARLVALLARKPRWRSWPLERIIRSRESFFVFLGERWPHFLVEQGFEPVPGREPPRPTIPGPMSLPFDHEDVRVYMDNLFTEGLLEPTAAVHPDREENWFTIGIVGSTDSSAEGRFVRMFDELRVAVPSSAHATHQEWQDFALRWGTWSRLRWQKAPNRDTQSEAAAQEYAEHVQDAFSTWLLRSFGPLSTLPYLPRPVLGHHIPHHLAYHLGQKDGARIALIVLDGMAMDQWVILRESMSGYRFDEHAIFSWVPTLTQISRQAIFSGRIPLEFSGSIQGTHREPQHWMNFWQDRGVRGPEIRYVKPQGNGEPTSDVIQRLLEAASPGVRVMGGVIGFIDQSLHQVGRGTRGLHAIVEEWAESQELSHLLDVLLAKGFEIFLTADHGNVHGKGIGKPSVGVTAQQRGERVHIFRNRELRDRHALDYPNAIQWPQVGLPEDYFPLIAPFGSVFVREGTQAVSHGGIALEEVMVPFIRVSAVG